MRVSVLFDQDLVDSDFLVKANGCEIKELVLLLWMDLAAVNEARMHDLANQVKRVVILIIFPVTMSSLFLIHVPDPDRAISSRGDQVVVVLRPRHAMDQVVVSRQHDLQIASLIGLTVKDLDDSLVVLECTSHS